VAFFAKAGPLGQSTRPGQQHDAGSFCPLLAISEGWHPAALKTTTTPAFSTTIFGQTDTAYFFNE
jgi:hypothetical protein